MNQSIKLDVRINITSEGTTIEVFPDHQPMSEEFIKAVERKVLEAVVETVIATAGRRMQRKLKLSSTYGIDKYRKAVSKL
ncbi:MAG TPA: hypothetical protein VF077_09535 [Nitrospiraceae bacterium]